MNRKIQFTTPENNLLYKPEKKLSKFFQICYFKNPKTNKFHIRKILYNQDGKILGAIRKMYTSVQMKKFYQLHKKQEYQTYNTYDIELVKYPTEDQLMMNMSCLINNDYESYDFAKVDY
jgi:hypothetical protein